MNEPLKKYPTEVEEGRVYEYQVWREDNGQTFAVDLAVTAEGITVNEQYLLPWSRIDAMRAKATMGAVCPKP